MSCTPSEPWRIDADAAARYASGLRCDIERITSREFHERFARDFAGRRPVIVTDFLDNEEEASAWPPREAWRREALIARHGNASVQASDGSSVVRSAGYEPLAMPLRRLLTAEMSVPGPSAAVAFDAHFHQTMPSLLAGLVVAPAGLRFSDHADSRGAGSWHVLSIGSSRSGLTFHQHLESWLMLYYGRKRWLMLPPEGKGRAHAYVGVHSAVQWIDQVLPTLAAEERPLECMQEAGELLYLPAHWPHLTLNIGDAVGLAEQRIAEPRITVTDRVYLDVYCGGGGAGGAGGPVDNNGVRDDDRAAWGEEQEALANDRRRVVIGLFGEAVPKTARHFLAAFTRRLYREQRVRADEQLGVLRVEPEGGEAAASASAAAEASGSDDADAQPFRVRPSLAGLLLMGTPTARIRSQAFLLTTGAAPHLERPKRQMRRGPDGKPVTSVTGHPAGGFVVFGRVLENVDALMCAMQDGAVLGDSGWLDPELPQGSDV